MKLKNIKQLLKLVPTLVSICQICWNNRNPNSKVNPVAGMGELKHCYFCGRAHRSGIFITIKTDMKGGD